MDKSPVKKIESDYLLGGWSDAEGEKRRSEWSVDF